FVKQTAAKQTTLVQLGGNIFEKERCLSQKALCHPRRSLRYGAQTKGVGVPPPMAFQTEDIDWLVGALDKVLSKRHLSTVC
ncbi:hypothetical protein LAV69_20195, partial [Klebsiella quasipneumoniae subsp. quasipneumoniae]